MGKGCEMSFFFRLLLFHPLVGFVTHRMPLLDDITGILRRCVLNICPKPKKLERKLWQTNRIWHGRHKEKGRKRENERNGDRDARERARERERIPNEIWCLRSILVRPFSICILYLLYVTTWRYVSEKKRVRNSTFE